MSVCSIPILFCRIMKIDFRGALIDIVGVFGYNDRRHIISSNIKLNNGGSGQNAYN